ncbi:hypothetical protein ACFFUT_13165 [Pseudohalocynthiibacter aestuariivivens]|uniref:Uncharacterized protein n=1 Tax=Pseudohalocynthiibacter aestuariivivens TaxID=1591409 RepID=A0ABV5JJQ8_9RHOB|nr:hypothetical protein [Pseudohalocynthiibacter aestuariivivens]MBS9718219.1 hypothetical protein [Pseudohalocynthiibacter aestuariivivens]
MADGTVWGCPSISQATVNTPLCGATLVWSGFEEVVGCAPSLERTNLGGNFPANWEIDRENTEFWPIFAMHAEN